MEWSCPICYNVAMPDAAIIIVNYNTRDLLAQCLHSVYASRCIYPFHVIVVDNLSTDNSADMLLAQFPQASLITSDRNGGFGYANNLALRWLSSQPSLPNVPVRIALEGPESGVQSPTEIPDHGDSPFKFPCDYALLLNPDTVLSPHALQETIDFLAQHADAGVVGPKMVKPDGSLDLACRRSFPTPASSLYKLIGLSKLFPRSRMLARYNLTYLRDDETAEVDSVMGAYMLIRGSALGEAGLFDEQFFLYGEDLDLAYRIKERGWKVFYYPEVEVLHHKGASSRKQSDRSIREFYRAMHVFHRKHYSQQYIGPINAVITLGIGLRGSLALLQNALRPAERKRVT